MRTSVIVWLCWLTLCPATRGAAQQQSGAVDTSKKAFGRGDSAQTLGTLRITTTRGALGYSNSLGSSATRSNLSLRDTPRAVTVITHQLIADQAMQGMADLVRYVPGVSMGSGEGHRDAPTIRGNNTTADFFVDGTRDDAQYLRDVYNVDRVEVLKGPEALLFGRGGGGGVINRVTRQAGWTPTASLAVQGGSFDHKRSVIDVGQAVDQHVAARLLGMYERSGGFRDAASLARYGINPTIALTAGSRALLRVGYELFDDDRRIDRGIPSYNGRPAPVDITTFFGNPSLNFGNMRANIGTFSAEYQGARGVGLRNRTMVADYDKFYQNTLPGAVDATGTDVSLSAYNHAIQRRNVFTSSDATFGFGTGPLRHAMLVGVDVGQQRTEQVRRTGYYKDSTTSFMVSLAAPTTSIPVVFRQSATDADNRTVTYNGAVYVQDQIALTSQWLAIAGVRYDRFHVNYHNNRSNSNLERLDQFLTPRAGLVFKPATPASLYASYGVSHLPSAGDQFTALTVTTATLEPERFTSREVGAKWNVSESLSLTTALYRLDRTNTSAPDPNNAGVTIQTGSQRTTGWEFGATGAVSDKWQTAAGIATQRARIVGTTTAAKAGSTVALVPHTALSLWNRYQVAKEMGLGLGVIHQTSMYAAVDNTVVLPGFTRIDAALYAGLRPGIRAQVNIENVLDVRYYATTQGNNNIVPGTPRSLRLSLELAH